MEQEKGKGRVVGKDKSNGKVNAGDLSLHIVSNGIMWEEKLDEEDELGMSWMLVSLSTFVIDPRL